MLWVGPPSTLDAYLSGFSYLCRNSSPVTVPGSMLVRGQSPQNGKIGIQGRGPRKACDRVTLCHPDRSEGAGVVVDGMFNTCLLR
jgi:hypothetical protein